jgi:Tol biopolymer transport system component
LLILRTPVHLEWLDWPVVSPDGRRLVFTGVNAEGKKLLWMHSLDSLATESLAGTDGASLSFWSPDSARY